jgi:hypothetical protein
MFDKEPTVEDLNQRYQEGKANLTRHFAELRANVLLDSGYHHNRRFRWRDARPQRTNTTKKVKITKNHVQTICRHIENNILNANPGTGFFPRHERELKHQKTAEMCDSVWQYQRDKLNEDQQRKELAHDFVVEGETFLKVAWDKMGGTFLGYDQSVEVDLETGEEMPIGEPQPIWTGALVWERMFPFDVITDPHARSWEATRWVICRKLIPIADLKATYAFDDEKLEFISEATSDDTYQIFDGLTGMYNETKEHCLVREMYIRPCTTYPRGYYFFFTQEGILEQGELPSNADGKPLPFPIQYVGYDQSNTSVRSWSVIKQIKPLQMEINRAASAIVMESLVLGHSTVLSQAGSKLSTAGIGNGMKSLTYTGVKPDILRGSNGDQYMSYVAQQTQEMYELAGVPYREQDKPAQTNDTLALLFRSLKDKKRFSYYAEKFERFLTQATELSIALCRIYMSEEELVPMVGKNEVVNMEEFKNTDPLHTLIKTRPRSDDFVSMMGKSIQVSSILQYAGSSLSATDVGILARNLPFLNEENIIEDSVLDYDIATNTILSLDRGEIPPIQDVEDHAYQIKRLTNRQKKPDYALLDQNIKNNYQDRIDMHMQFMISQQQEAAKANAGYIPSGGGLVAVDMYIDKDGKQRRARLPYESLNWLVNRLQAQGTQQEVLSELPNNVQAQMGNVSQLPAR